jgi:hypothetical protein
MALDVSRARKVCDVLSGNHTKTAQEDNRPDSLVDASYQVGNGKKTALILSSGNVGYEECAEKLFPVLAASHRYFIRGNLPVELTKGKQGHALEDLKPAAFRSRLETFFSLYSIRQLGHGETATKPSHCSHDLADVLLHTTAARNLLPTVNIITQSPIFTEVDGRLVPLPAGYHNVLGGVIVLRNRDIRLIPLPEAVAALLALMDDFDFVSPSDKSRAVASFLSPAFRFGALLNADFPIDLAEANESQSGKTYRQKLVARLYGERPFVINKGDERGVGSVSEFVSEGLISGRPFLMFENIRRKLDCQLLESALRGEGSVLCRTAYSKATQIDATQVCWMLSSNKAEVTPDLANRSIITRVRKQAEGFHFKIYPKGDVLQHVQANTEFYLSCVFSVVNEWYRNKKPLSKDTRHDFREWCQTFDYIVQEIFGLPPLLNGHVSEQLRVANPELNWLRDVAIAIEKEDKLGDGFKPSEIVDICETFGIEIPGVPGWVKAVRTEEGTGDRVLFAVGKLLKRIFEKGQFVETGGFCVKRVTDTEYNANQRKNLPTHYHYFEHIV